jgi:CheY-like chemotaxis protein
VKAVDRILLVEDKESLRAVLRKTLEAEGFGVEEAPDGRAAMDKIRRDRFAMVLTDLRLPAASGHEVLQAALSADPATPVILMTAYGTIRDAVGAMKAGAYDYLEKPVDSDHLLALIRRALEHRSLLHENTLLKERFSQELDVPEILGESAALKRALDQVRRVAGTDATVLLLGESGSGKELFARAVHHLSGRKTHSFFPINCAAIPENLLESELFGYERGAFTGATGTKRGKFEIADKGTLFLDEIGDLSLGLQGKVLRVIEQRQFERVGGDGDAQRRHPAGRGDQQRSEGAGRPGGVPAGPLLPAVGVPDHRAPPARPPGGHPDPGAAFPQEVRRRAEEAGTDRPAAGDPVGARGLLLARERARAGERHRARPHPWRGRTDPAGAPAAPGGAPGRLSPLILDKRGLSAIVTRFPRASFAVRNPQEPSIVRLPPCRFEGVSE